MKQINLRLDDRIHGALVALAKSEHRSLHGQILSMLEETLRNQFGVHPMMILNADQVKDGE